MELPEITISSFEEKESKEFVDQLQETVDIFGSNQSILIKIDSFGGSIYGMAMIYEALKSIKNPVVTYTSSKAMSAGAIILASAASPSMRFASPNSSIMLHELSAGSLGHIQDMENELDMLKVINARWMGILAASMGLKSAQELKKLIDLRGKGRDLYLTAQEAKKLKVVDQVGYLNMSVEKVYKLELKK